MDREDIEKLIEEDVPVEEIAEDYSGEFCIQDFDMENEYCHEDADCHDCWVKCLENKYINK